MLGKNGQKKNHTEKMAPPPMFGKAALPPAGHTEEQQADLFEHKGLKERSHAQI